MMMLDGGLSDDSSTLVRDNGLPPVVPGAKSRADGIQNAMQRSSLSVKPLVSQQPGGEQSVSRAGLLAGATQDAQPAHYYSGMNLSRCLLLAIGLIGLLGVLVSRPRPPSLLPGTTPASSMSALTAAEGDFYQTIEPQLAAAATEADTVATLGEQRSRNLFAIRRAEAILEARLVAIDRATPPGRVPTRFAVAIERYRQGAEHLRMAMGEARSAFAGLDWERLDAAVTRSREGADALAGASNELHMAAREAMT